MNLDLPSPVRTTMRRVASASSTVRTLAIIALGALAMAACKPSEPAKPAATAAPAANAPAADAPPSTADASAADTPATPTEAGSEPEIPTLSIKTVDGKTYDLASHRGKWVVVNFWATWCAPCRKEMPELSALDAMRENVEVIGLAYEEIAPEEMAAFLDKHPVVYPIAIVDVMNPPADFATPRGLPMTYLIAPDGKIAKRVIGPVTARELEDAIAAGAGATATG